MVKDSLRYQIIRKHVDMLNHAIALDLKICSHGLSSRVSSVPSGPVYMTDERSSCKLLIQYPEEDVQSRSFATDW